MRKLIVLIMTSVLATGAVAQADTVNVTADPGKLIRIVELQKVPKGTATASRSSLAADEELKVYDNVFADGSVHYTIDLEVVDENDTLKQVAVCFYDSKAPDGTELDGTEIATTCGNGFTNVDSLATGENNQGNEILDAAGGGAFLPQSAVQMGFIPLIINPNDANVSVMNHATDRSRDANDNDRAHLVYANVESGNGSLYSEESQFNGETIGEAGDNNVWDITFRFALKKFAHNSADWKIRVVATYDGATISDPDQVVELIDTETYTVGYFGEFDTVERPTQDFQNVIDGGSKEITGITTGEYFVNSASDIYIKASAFTGSPGTLSFDDNPTISGDQVTPAVGEISMKCIGNEPEEFMAAATPGKLLADVPANSAETTLAGATTRKVAPTHDCTLFIGDDVATGSYSNDVTVSIGKKDAGAPSE